MSEQGHFYVIQEREIAIAIIRALHRDVGVDLLPILTDESRTFHQRRNRAARVLLEALLTRADEGPHRDEWRTPEGVDEDPFLRSLAAEDVEVEPNIVIAESEAARLRNLQGQAVKDYMYTLSERMKQMAKASTPADLALQIVTGGLISVGASMAVGTVQALRAGQVLLTAVRVGVMGIGMKTAVGVVVIVLASLLLWLLLENPKKILGLVINDTDHTLVVNNWRAGVGGGGGSNLWMNHGSMKNFMQDYEGGNLTKQVQINARAFFAPNDPDNAVYGGIYFADKNFGFRGSEGIMLFTSTRGGLNFAHMFAVPYTKDNGTNMAVTGTSANLPTLFRQLYDSRAVRVDRVQNGFRFTSTVNDARGGVVGCIASVTAL